MESKKQFSQIGLLMFLSTIIINGLQIISVIIARNIPAVAADNDLLFIVGMMPTYLIGYPIIFMLFKKVPLQISGERKKMSFGQLLAAFLMAYALTYVCNFVGTFITSVVEEFTKTPVENVLTELLNQISPITTFFIAVLIAPIMEELLFRKTVIDRTAQYGDGISIVFSGLLFGLFHGNLNQFAYAIALGMFFGFIYIKTKNILYPIILHFLTNFVGSLVPIYVMKESRYMEYETKLMELMASPEYTDAAGTALAQQYQEGITMVFGYLLLLFGMVITGIILLIVRKKKFVLTPGEITIAKGERLRTIFMNPGMLLYLAFWVLMIVLQLLGV